MIQQERPQPQFQRKMRRIRHDERGQMFVWALLSLQLLLFGAAGFVIDMGRVYVSYQQLVMATNAAALAGGYGLPISSTAITDANNYSGVAGTAEYNTGLSGITMASGYPQVKCIEYSVLPIPCAGSGSSPTYNVIQVKQQVTVPMTLARFFGARNVTLTSTSTASARGAPSTPYNIAMIIDTTESMGSSGSDSCTDPYTNKKYTTSEGCALVGARVLLHNTAPCAGDLSTCPTGDTNAVDMISLLTFPNGEASTMKNDYTGSCSGPTINTTAGYSFPDLSDSTAFPGLSNTSPSTITYGSNTDSSGSSVSGTNGPSGTTASYQVTGFLSDYRTSDSSTSLSTSSNLVAAVGGTSSCKGLQTPGGLGTFYAGALVAAQELLIYQQGQRTGSQNAIILLSDGAANATKMAAGTLAYVGSSSQNRKGTVAATSGSTYPSTKQQCQQAVNVAQSITKSGTVIYSVAYGSTTSHSDCTTDTGSITPCSAMSSIASNARTFFSDNPGGKSSGCTSSENPETGLAQIFGAIAGDLTKARLVPNNVFSAGTA